MGSLLQCLFRICCDDDDEEQQESQHGVPSQRPAPARMTRGVRVVPDPDSGVYQVAPQASSDEQEEEGNADSCHPESEGNPHDAGIREFFRKLGEKWGMHDSLASLNERSATDGNDPTDILRRPRSASINSPLRTASSFDASREFPTICPDEVVLPGSLLQTEIAKAASLNLEHHGDECVICMEGFDPTNPRMPTICGCGENKTYFHLPCLYQWIEQSRDCPSCRQKLRWQEF
jgi:hypothetical protein